MRVGDISPPHCTQATQHPPGSTLLVPDRTLAVHPVHTRDAQSDESHDHRARHTTTPNTPDAAGATPTAPAYTELSMTLLSRTSHRFSRGMLRSMHIPKPTQPVDRALLHAAGEGLAGELDGCGQELTQDLVVVVRSLGVGIVHVWRVMLQ